MLDDSSELLFDRAVESLKQATQVKEHMVVLYGPHYSTWPDIGRNTNVRPYRNGESLVVELDPGDGT